MRMMKKVMTGMSLAAAALAIAGGVNAADADAAVTLDKVSVSGDATMEVETISGAKEIWVSYDAVKEKSGAPVWNAKAKWDVYDDNYATVDLSTLKISSKDAYVAIKDDTDATPLVLKFTADKSKLKGKYKVDKVENGDKTTSYVGAIEFSGNDKGGTKVEYDYTKAGAPALQYRTLQSTYDTEGGIYVYEDEAPVIDRMSDYEKQGTTLYFRYAGVDLSFYKGDAYSESTDITPVYEDAAKKEGLLFNMATQQSGRFAGAEVKVKIGKEANAPSATIDYDKGVFKLKKNVEYRQIIGGSYVKPEVLTEKDSWKERDWTLGNATTTAEVKIDVEEDGIFEIRTAASEKKVASKIAVYSYAGVPTPEASDEDGEGSIANGVRPVSGSAVEIKAKDSGLNIKYEKDTKGKVAITFSNTNKDAGYVVYSEDPAAVAKPKAVATVKAKDATGYKDVKVATSTTKLADKSDVWICTASDKKTGVFRSKAEKIKIDYNVGLGNTNRES